MSHLSKFTVVGYYDPQQPIFITAFAESLQQLEDVWKALYPQRKGLVLKGHVVAADDRENAPPLDEIVRLVCENLTDPRCKSPALLAYRAWFEAPETVF